MHAWTEMYYLKPAKKEINVLPFAMAVILVCVTLFLWFGEIFDRTKPAAPNSIEAGNKLWEARTKIPYPYQSLNNDRQHDLRVHVRFYTDLYSEAGYSFSKTLSAHYARVEAMRFVPTVPTPAEKIIDRVGSEILGYSTIDTNYEDVFPGNNYAGTRLYLKLQHIKIAEWVRSQSAYNACIRDKPTDNNGQPVVCQR